MLTLQTLETIQKRVKLSSGVELPYVEQGDPAGVPVIFLHGITDSWHSFEPVLPHLPGSVHVFALSQRGHGDADCPETGYHPRDFAADLAAFMDALELGPAVIAGHSMGSTIAQRFALDYPGCTRGLVLIGSCPTFRGNAGLVELWEVAVSQLEDPIDPDFVREFQESTLAQPVPPAFLDTVVQESLKLPARVWRAVLLQALLEADFSVELGKITAPTLIVWGDQDGLVSRHEQEALLAAIAGSQLVVYRGAGHAEEPERFAADLVAFTENFTKAGRG
ncbi:MAG: alpha/beta hydrolase [Anaerolineales bacterium]|nr:alpha/beta hydrolase [Anaerolineales bacterium]